ncbi:AMP-binding protein [Micromonospora echinaurantiaca]|uniref:AMP-binding protein n=1 Tax=Micromonospora echinaurantiaca TaxID=47857 RepID=UPI0037B42A69
MPTTTEDDRPATGSRLLSWVERPGPGVVRFAAAGDGWDEWPYPRLAAAVRRVAGGLRAAGVRRDDRVVLVEPTGPGFVAGYFGTMLAGAVPTPVAPPALGQDLAGYLAHVRHIVATAAPRLVVTGGTLAEPLRPVAGDAGVVRTADLLDGADAPAAGRRAGLALLQFTSGSTGRPRAVRVPFAALEHNVAAIGRWLRQGPADPTASWLPLHHDMGLIGCLLTPVAHQGDLWLLTPQQFVRDPLRYLRCFGQRGARLTAMPTFGLRHVVDRVRPEQLAGLDFAAWRAVIVGAERVSPAALEDFWRLLAPHGLDRRALLPAYGLAEATLAVTGGALDEPWRTARVDPARIPLGGAPGGGPAAAPLVGCGAPLDGVSVRIVDDAGRPLPDGRVGEIEVGGRCVAAGYLGDPAGTSARFTAGALRTGDSGFLHDGQLYVLGRLGDSLKLRGRTLFAEDVEAALEAAGLPRHRHTVLLGHADRPVAMVLLENAEPDWEQRAGAVVGRLTEGAELIALRVPVGTILRTTSGKPRRRVMWQRFRDVNGGSHRAR